MITIKCARCGKEKSYVESNHTSLGVKILLCAEWGVLTEHTAMCIDCYESSQEPIDANVDPEVLSNCFGESNKG